MSAVPSFLVGPAAAVVAGLVAGVAVLAADVVAGLVAAAVVAGLVTSEVFAAACVASFLVVFGFSWVGLVFSAGLVCVKPVAAPNRTIEAARRIFFIFCNLFNDTEIQLSMDFNKFSLLIVPVLTIDLQLKQYGKGTGQALAGNLDGKSTLFSIA
jgi:hypothetical protein